MTEEQKQVSDFMRTFGQEVKSSPEIPSLEIRKLRARLILEEALETIINGLGVSDFIDGDGCLWDLEDMLQSLHKNANFQCCKKPSLEQIADGLADLHYVAYCGTGVACGIDMEKIFAEVHRSNMSKMWSCSDVSSFCCGDFQVIAAIDAPVGMEFQAGDYIFKKVKPTLWMVNNKSGKIIKSPSYSPANFKELLK